MRISALFMIPLLLIGFVAVHIVKMMRLYLVLLEQKIEFKRFVFSYLHTTLVNLLIPFKLGEIYRVAAFSAILKSFKIGLFSVLVDRFFDTMALILILLPFQILITGHVAMATVFLAVFVIVILFVFWMFPSAYGYLNRYIIMNRSSKRSLAVLRGLEVLKSWYDYVKQLVSGRYALMLLMSFAAWMLESAVLSGVARLYGISFDREAFSDYISSILSTTHNDLMRIYTCLSLVLITIATIVMLMVILCSRRVKKHGTRHVNVWRQ